MRIPTPLILTIDAALAIALVLVASGVVRL
jgi:hypothetical protein